jgi:hypothetical protein
MKLTDEQIDFIRSEIESSGLSMPALKDDLLDHFCCFIEHEMKKGQSFLPAYAQAKVHICPGGFAQIEKETLFLLNAKRIMVMKKLMYFIGLISAMSISLGWLFKILHWPGGGELFTYGFLAFVLLFLPLLAIDRYKLNLQAAMSEKLRLALGFGSAIVTGLAVLFKMLHLQGADMLLIGGALLFVFGFLPFLFFRMYRKAIS